MLDVGCGTGNVTEAVMYSTPRTWRWTPWAWIVRRDDSRGAKENAE